MNEIGAGKMRELAHLIEEKIKGYGFALFVFPFSESGISNYISNAQRDDMIKALEEKISIFKNKKDFKTPEEN